METGLLFRTVVVGNVERRFAVYVPRDYDAVTPLPLVVFLHGSGECGTDGQKQTVTGLGSAALIQREKWPFIIVFPQKPDQPSLWADHGGLVMACLYSTRMEFKVDPSRVYLTGLSQGGAGAWAIGARHPTLWAAVAPVCGFCAAETVAEVGRGLKDMPVWAFHGEKDDIVKPAQTRALVAAMQAAGGVPRATYFPDANHNSWDKAYREMDLGAWLLGHSRPK